jgi:hypothetical protein
MPGFFLDLQNLLVRHRVDPQVGHAYGKLRSLGLILRLLGVKSIACLRQRAFFTTFPGVKCATPQRDRQCDVRVVVTSQKEEASQGLVQRSMPGQSIIAVVDTHNFVPKGSDRELVAWAGCDESYPRLYSRYFEDKKAPPLNETRNLFFQDLAEDFLRYTTRKELRFLDLFDHEETCTATFPWFRKRGWLSRWAYLIEKYPWFRKRHKQHFVFALNQSN